jgi:ABC-type branched-subunit amino acid transport system substrate-binding protein
MRSASVLEGALGTQPTGPEPSTEAGRALAEFERRFEARFSRRPNRSAANAYDAFYVAALALEAAGPSADRARFRDAAMKVLEGTTALPAGDFALLREAVRTEGAVRLLGTVGEVHFDDRGDLRPPWYIAIQRVTGAAFQTAEVVTVREPGATL